MTCSLFRTKFCYVCGKRMADPTTHTHGPDLALGRRLLWSMRDSRLVRGALFWQVVLNSLSLSLLVSTVLSRSLSLFLFSLSLFSLPGSSAALTITLSYLSVCVRANKVSEEPATCVAIR